MRKERNTTGKYSALKQIYRENYLEDVSQRLRNEAENAKEDCS